MKFDVKNEFLDGWKEEVGKRVRKPVKRSKSEFWKNRRRRGAQVCVRGASCMGKDSSRREQGGRGAKGVFVGSSRRE